MRFHALAVDYDGTLAQDGQVAPSTLCALERVKASGRRLILVTGRRLEQLQEIFPGLPIFGLIVAENGALVFDPDSGETQLLCEPVSPEFADMLQARGVERLERGQVIVATWQPHQHDALEAIRQLNLDLQIIFNKDAVMILPTGVNKAAGLAAALDQLGISSLNTVAVGDAENDLAMLKFCGASVAVDNALPTVKEVADRVTSLPRGQGVEQLIDELLDNDLETMDLRSKHGLVLGEGLDNRPFTVDLFGESVLVTGGSGGGKSKFAMSFVEQLSHRNAQSVILDPEGDYQNLDNSIVLGTGERPPQIEEVMRILDQPSGHFVVSFFRVAEDERPRYFDKLLHELSSLRAQKGRPHWIIVDEAHYAAPRDWQPAENWSAQQLTGVMFISAFHERLSPAVLRSVDTLISIADQPAEALKQCCQLLEVECENMDVPEGDGDHFALAWKRGAKRPTWFRRILAKSESQRHKHSYYDGDMDDEHRFVFRGPRGKLQLAAQNLKVFMQMAEGVDDDTWLYHLRRHDYSKWLDGIIKDEQLAAQVRSIENDRRLSAEDSRRQVFEWIQQQYAPRA